MTPTNIILIIGSLSVYGKAKGMMLPSELAHEVLQMRKKIKRLVGSGKEIVRAFDKKTLTAFLYFSTGNLSLNFYVFFPLSLDIMIVVLINAT